MCARSSSIGSRRRTHALGRHARHRRHPRATGLRSRHAGATVVFTPRVREHRMAVGRRTRSNVEERAQRNRRGISSEKRDWCTSAACRLRPARGGISPRHRTDETLRFHPSRQCVLRAARSASSEELAAGASRRRAWTTRSPRRDLWTSRPSNSFRAWRACSNAAWLRSWARTDDTRNRARENVADASCAPRHRFRGGRAYNLANDYDVTVEDSSSSCAGMDVKLRMLRVPYVVAKAR